MTFETAIKTNKITIENILQRELGLPKGPESLLFEAMTHSLMAGGKRLRPMILLEVYKLFEADTTLAEPFAAAIEMIHTYSLIHDDLPAMDDDAIRRGLPTCHVKYGEDIAILAGDGLLNKAFEVMIDATMTYNLGNNGLRAMACLGEKAGTRGMIGGQVVDTLSDNKEVNLATVEYIHLHKTSALLEAAFMMGAYLAGATEATVLTMETIGRSVGMAFQIQDDLLDITSTNEKLGKPINSDEKNAKMTYVALKGIKASKADVVTYLDQAAESVASLQFGDTTFLESLIQFIRNRDY